MAIPQLSPHRTEVTKKETGSTGPFTNDGLCIKQHLGQLREEMLNLRRLNYRTANCKRFTSAVYQIQRGTENTPSPVS